jgi:hypothetical protein
MKKETIHNQESYFNAILEHYEIAWNRLPNFYLFDKGPIDKLPFNFRVLEFKPDSKREMWTYSTCCMSQVDDVNPIELHIFSAKQDTSIVELLTVVAYYHNNTKKLALNDVLNFGRPWQSSSSCEFGFISLPYLDGPGLENFNINGLNKPVKFFWLIPITSEEFEYRIKYGSNALEEAFEEKGLDYLDCNRKSMV